MAVTVQDLAEHFKLSTDSNLGRQVSDEHIKEISTFLESWKLVAPHLGLSQGAIETIDNDGKGEEQKRLLMLQKWKQALFFKATYQKLLEGLLGVQRADLGGKVCEMVAASSHQSVQKPDVKLMMTKHADELKGGLSHIKRYRDPTHKTAAQVMAVTDFIHQCIESENLLKEVEEQLQVLYLEEFLISKEVYEKCQKIAADEYAKEKSQYVPKPFPNAIGLTESGVVESLFCKDTIYHASICSQAVSAYTAGDYQKFFKDRKLVPGHGFKAVSFSRPKEGSLLIAQKGDSTFYFAFKGQPNLSYWTRGYKSIGEGIMKQCDMFPTRYIIELLNKQHRIVLTGFSFGGVLASAVTASVWDTPYISSDLLKNNMICVTFGQPRVTVDVVQRVARRRPEMIETINDIVIEGDEIPMLMGLLDESWSGKAQKSQDGGTQNVHLSATVNHANALEDKTTSELLTMFAQVQDGGADAKVVQKIKALLQEILQCAGSTSSQHTPALTSYCVSTKERELVLTPIADFTDSQIQMLSDTMFNKHLMIEYSKGIFEGHLDKYPKYSFPETLCRALDDVADLKPSVNGIQIHHHGSESAIVIEGTHLWFCFQVSFRGHKMSVPASDVSGSSIQFNVAAFPSCSDLSASKKEVVSLESYFKAKPTRFDVEVFEKRYSTTTRQEQLAKLTPSQVIELGYLSALLEHHCGSISCPAVSHKFEVIKKFLEDVVTAVPFESIAYAIANTSYSTAMQCSKALTKQNVEIPITLMMYHGLNEAITHLKYGVSTGVLQSLEFDATAKHPRFDMNAHCVYMESDKLVYEHHTGFGLSPAISQTQVKPSESLAGTFDAEIIAQLEECERRLDYGHASSQCSVVSKRSIKDLYPILPNESAFLKSPLEILVDGQKKLRLLSGTSPSACCNKKMLDIVNSIRQNELDTCTSLLGGFMYQGSVAITLASYAEIDRTFLLMGAASIGVWTLFSLDYNQVAPILAKCQGKQLLVKLFDYVEGISGLTHIPDENIKANPYAAKLQFMTQGMTKTVTCNTEYVSYSLERQLVELCSERSISATTSLEELTGKWSTLFKGKTLSLVHHKSRLLIAFWLKWALMIHNLREELAMYTAVGVVGLVNSGKSKLVNTLFGIEIPTGTTEGRRTTVPFLYNLEESVDGLNVVDFPGVDDEDDSIGDLADLLLTIAQIIVFVVDYRKVHTQSAKKWLERLHREKVPTLVCLTFGDKLYAEHMTDSGEHPSVTDMSKVTKSQLSVTRDKLRPTGSHEVQFFSFCQDKDSVLNSDEGRKKLRDVGIETPLQVGEWLVKVFRDDFKHNELANQLEVFMNKNVK